MAHRLAPSHLFPYAYPEEIFRELRRVSCGSICDYSGISYERMDKEMGVFWPCPKEGHPGTPRLFEGGKFYHPDGRARFHGRVEKA